MTLPNILRIVLPIPSRQGFDYLPPSGVTATDLVPGTGLRVPFGNAQKIGILLEVVSTSAVAAPRLKRALGLIEPAPLVPPNVLELLLWAARYYHRPVGEVIRTGLPSAVLKGACRTSTPRPAGIRLTPAGRNVRSLDPPLRRAPRQRQLLKFLTDRAGGATLEAVAGLGGDWRRALATLLERGWVERFESQEDAVRVGSRGAEQPPPLASDQQAAVDAVCGSLHGYHAFLLDGVTGSGKTEVYLRIIDAVLRENRQALVLVPEIGLTPQLVRRFERRFRQPIAVLHSMLTDQERATTWRRAADGRVAVIIGTRSAVFVALARPGILIVDEEHDLSFKQQHGLRYCARDVAVMRARLAGVPVVLGSATPSLESLHNAAQGRYRRLALHRRAAGASAPAVQVLDVRALRLDQGLSRPLIEAIDVTLGRGEQVLLFLNRRGYAPVLACCQCGWAANCPHCDARMTWHRRLRRVVCHYCAAEQAVGDDCPQCGARSLYAVGHGTQQIEEGLARHFPDVAISRIDRDTTRRRGALEQLLESARGGGPTILLGTQMLAKGHHFPGVTLVAVLDADPGLFSTDFRASEHLAQLIVQVAGRAGRAEKPGRVLIQTRFPDHPLLVLLIKAGYGAFGRAALAERRDAGLPPWTYQALLRAEARDPQQPTLFLQYAADRARAYASAGVDVLGPVAAAMARQAGRYRAEVLLQAGSRAGLHSLLDTWIPELAALPGNRRVRWSIDVDPRGTV